jgi:hypothetical protein
LPYREREEEGGEGEADEEDDGKRSEGLGFERLFADAFYLDNADREGCKVTGITGSCQ